MNLKINSNKYSIGLIVTILILLSFPLLSTTNITKKITANSLITSRIIQWIFLICLWLYTNKIEKQKLLLWENLKLSPSKILLHTILLYISAITLLIPITALYLSVKPLETSPLLVILKPILIKNQFLIPVISITAGIIEELIFRGYLQSRLHRLFKNPYIAIGLTTLLFAFTHIGYGTFQNFMGPLIIGLLFSMYYWKYKNIIPLIVCHCMIDIISLTAIIHR